MNAHRLRIGAHVADRLRAHHLADEKRAESISLALGHAYTDAGGSVTIVLADPEAVLLFADDCYDTRSHARAELRLDVRAAAYWHAVESGYTAVVDVHDHHFASDAVFSPIDDADDENTERFFSETMPQFKTGKHPVHAAALLLSRGEWAARVVWSPGAACHGAAMSVDSVGQRYQLLSAMSRDTARPSQARQSEVVPPPIQNRIGGMGVAVVGNGGTGSVAAEALARLGFGTVVLIDPGIVDETNLNRMQGAGPDDIGHPKSEVLARHLSRCCPHVQIHALSVPVWDRSAVAALEQVDCIVGCVDNGETRWWLNRFSVQYMTPWFDCAVLIETLPQLRMSARSSIVIPGAGPCGHCSPLELFPRGRPDDFVDATTLAEQRAAGYVAQTPAMRADPSIYPLNLQAVALAMQELVQWFTGGRPVAHSILCVAASSEKQSAREWQVIDLAAFGGGAAVDCQLCCGTLGRCRSDPLPEPTAQTFEPINFITTSEHHGQDESPSIA